jgi:DNA-binding CsgD family transcriptional regulator
VSDQQQRVVDWLDDVLEWLQEPLTEMPIEVVFRRLRLAYDVNLCSWTREEGALMTAMIFDQPDAMVSHSATMAEFMAGKHRDCHPLSAWYSHTPSTEPQTSERVPSRLVPPDRRKIMVAPLVELGLEQQMTLYYRREPTDAAFFVVARDRRDFDADDLVLARYVQRSLVTLDKQVRVLAARSLESAVSTEVGLTGRQLAVLQLLCDGLSTRQAARRLACSPRTVEKHLQHVYRKLEVRDRVNAMRVARQAGVVVKLPTASPDGTTGIHAADHGGAGSDGSDSAAIAGPG